LVEQRKLEQEAFQQRAEAEREQQRAEKIQTLLSAADTDLKALRLTSPPGNNAFEGYRSVLELDPDNDRAPEGLLEIVNRYLEFKDRAVEQNDFDKAQGFLEKAETVLPGSELLVIAKAELDAARAEHEATQAQLAAEEAQRIEEESVRAQAEVERLAKAQAESERLKVEQEKLKQQMSEKTAQPTQKEVSDSIPPIAVAVFPFANRNPSFGGDAQIPLSEFAHRYISNNRQLRLSASYFKQKGSKIGGWTDYWSESKRPLDSQVFSHGARLGADVVLMYSYRGFSNSTRFTVWVYVFDIKNRLAYTATSNQDDYEDATESLIKDFLESWGGASAPSERSAASTGRDSDQLAKAQAEIEQLKAEQEAVKQQLQRETQSQSGASALATQPPAKELPVANAPLQVAIFFTLGGGGSRSAEEMLLGFAETYIKRNNNLDLKYSYYSSGFDEVGPGTKLWSGLAKHQPLTDTVYRTGARIGAEVVLMYYQRGTSADQWNMFRFEAFLFDINKKREYHYKGNQDNYEEGTKQLFEELIASRE